MSLDTGIHRVLLCVAAVWVVSLVEAADMCVACSYNFAGDGTTDYECVNDSLNMASSVNVSCNFATHSCTIMAQYQYTGFHHLQSVARSCLPSSNPSQVCDPSDGRYCVFECKTSFCNVAQDGDLAKTYAASDSETLVAKEAADMCVACSYNFAGDGTRDYECVNDSLNMANSVNVSCNFATHSCTITAEYRYRGFHHLQSVARSCLPSSNLSQVCDPSDRRYCVFECKTSFCNVAQDADLARMYAGI